uniref:Si:dkey-43k4.3 n=1 Tax=Oncorhynchus kisutch TaxID=8019 RepID=A0A8C7GIP7_ONCKI
MMETSSRDQARGGLWNCPRRTQYSKEIQDMLKLMMQESRLTNFQQRQLNDKLKKGSALPLTCNPTSSAPPSLPKPKVLKNSTNRTPAKPLRRTADNCSSGDNYTRDRFRPSATRDLEKEKRRLQNILATGQEEPRPSRPRNISLDQGPEEERDRFQEGEVYRRVTAFWPRGNMSSTSLALLHVFYITFPSFQHDSTKLIYPNPVPTQCLIKEFLLRKFSKDCVSFQVLDEIEERKEFLEEMTALGKGKQYRNIINTGISQVSCLIFL